MRNIKQNTEYYNYNNGNFSFFNSIKRSCLVGSDDAVEPVEGHADDEEGGAEDAGQGDRDDYPAVTVLTRRHDHLVNHVQITCQPWKEHTSLLYRVFP